MNPMVMVFIGFIAGMLAMTMANFYKWFLEIWNNGF